MAQIVHVDMMCNECGNCATFCPYDSAPYKDKFTLFTNEKDMADSTNEGFIVLDAGKKEYKVRLLGKETRVNSGDSSIPADLMAIMNTVCENYQYLLFK